MRVEGDLLIIEFEAPGGGFELTGAEEILAVGAGGSTFVARVARVDPERSTRAGRHAAGLTVRLAIRTADGSAWPHAAEVVLLLSTLPAGRMRVRIA
jgi:hypothetical protein